MADSEILISVIVPVYNVEAYIERCVASLIRQDFPLEKVEFIFVDDGSADQSVPLLRQLLSQNEPFSRRSRIISHDINRGLAVARTTGFHAANGKYVLSVDSDDYIEPDMLRLLYGDAVNSSADIVLSTFIIEKNGKSKNVGSGHWTPDLNSMAIDAMNFSLCNKLIRADLLKENQIYGYSDIQCWEDLGVTARIFALKPRVSFVDKPLYHYVKNPVHRSLTDRVNRDRILDDHLRMAVEIQSWLTERGLAEEYEEFLTRLKFCAKVKMMRGKGKQVARWKQTFPEVNSRILSIRRIPLLYRLMFKTVALLPTRLVQWIANRCDLFYR